MDECRGDSEVSLVEVLVLLEDKVVDLVASEASEIWEVSEAWEVSEVWAAHLLKAVPIQMSPTQSLTHIWAVTLIMIKHLHHEKGFIALKNHALLNGEIDEGEIPAPKTVNLR